MAILGPQGTSERFRNKVAALKAKYPHWSDVKARRIASGLSNTNTGRRTK